MKRFNSTTHPTANMREGKVNVSRIWIRWFRLSGSPFRLCRSRRV